MTRGLVDCQIIQTIKWIKSMHVFSQSPPVMIVLQGTGKWTYNEEGKWGNDTLCQSPFCETDNPSYRCQLIIRFAI